MVQNPTCWWASWTVRLLKQREVQVDWYELHCFGSPTVQLAPQHVWFCTMWPDHAKGLSGIKCPSGTYVLFKTLAFVDIVQHEVVVWNGAALLGLSFRGWKLHGPYRPCFFVGSFMVRIGKLFRGCKQTARHPMKSFGPGVQERKSLGTLINVMALMFMDIA